MENLKQSKEEGRDEELDIAKAIDVARNWIKRFAGGNLNLLQFKVEQVTKNGSETTYIVIVSVIPDLGEDRDYYLIRVDIKTGKIVQPIGKGKSNENGEIEFKKIDIAPEFSQ